MDWWHGCFGHYQNRVATLQPNPNSPLTRVLLVLESHKSDKIWLPLFQWGTKVNWGRESLWDTVILKSKLDFKVRTQPRCQGCESFLLGSSSYTILLFILVYSYVQIQHINPAYKSCTAKLVRRITLTGLAATDLYRAPQPHVEQRHSTCRVWFCSSPRVCVRHATVTSSHSLRTLIALALKRAIYNLGVNGSFIYSQVLGAIHLSAKRIVQTAPLYCAVNICHLHSTYIT